MPRRTRDPAAPPPRHPHDREFWRAVMADAGAAEAGARLRGGLSRRAFLQAIGASAALAGLGGCFEAPEEAILPYTRRPEDVLPGVPAAYATTFELGGHGIGLLVESHEGRPVKVEGNPDHPASLGAAGVFEQAWLLELYDPDRLRETRRRGTPTTWGRFLESLRAEAARDPELRGTRVLLEPTASPLVDDSLRHLRARRPGLGLHFYAPLHARAPREAARRLFGRALEPVRQLARAEVVLSLDDDFLGQGPYRLRHAHDFAERRRILRREGRMNRLYSVGPVPSLTAEMADHHRARPAREVLALAAAVTREVAARMNTAPEGLAAVLEPLARPARDRPFVRAVAEDLLAHRGRALVGVGDSQPLAAHALGHVLNALLESPGRTLRFVPSHLREARSEEETLPALVDAMRAGEVRRLVVLAGNPVYDAPADLGFADVLDEVPSLVALSLLPDETAARAEWSIPAVTGLEAWGDARALDGTASLVQPLIAPLHGGRTRSELLAALAGEAERTPYERLRESWARRHEEPLETWWRRALARGVIEGSAPEPVAARLDWGAALAILGEARPARAPAAPARELEDVELAFRPDASVLDGRFANNPWLQELPDPITKLTWDNAAWIPPSMARARGLGEGDWIRIRRGEREIEIPVIPVRGMAEGVVGLSLGYGRRGELSVARGAGFDVYPLFALEEGGGSARLAPAGDARPSPHPLARAQTHFDLHERGQLILHHQRLADYRSGEKRPGLDASLYHPPPSEGPQWGMGVDLTVCTGCAACVVACQAENNVPVVGKEGVRRGRAMHWLRIDRYEIGTPTEPRPVPQPMLCQHCEMAPCEYVCPVNATVHSEDGLNEMIYNRCVGTRFCSNNCPYKVRRFNWFEYNGDVAPERRMQHNPDVTVRARGVMEKCTYCVQRIRRAQIEAGREDRPLRDGEVRTACQEACPTRAIRFGDLRDPESEVSRVLRAPQAYAVLEELGTRPRTRYLARIHNPNERLERERKARAGRREEA